MADNKPDATQLEFFEIPSPCIGVCQSGPRGFCKGCYRSRDERLYWLRVDDATRRKIMTACYRRKKVAHRRALSKAAVDMPTTKINQIGLFDSPEDTDEQ
ncbi:DUF1289 domain-containing protein [Alteromonas sp.]|nr:DUF1289 domain-containing protein [Alteromonas sp.]